MTQKSEYQVVKGIYMDSDKVPPTSALENSESDISSVSRAAAEGWKDGGDKSGAKWLSGDEAARRTMV